MAPELDAVQLKTAREHVRALLERLVAEARTTGREMAVDALCSGLEAIPVPVLNTALSKTVRRLLKAPDHGPTLEDVAAMLDEMQTSDEAFETGLARLGIDLQAMAADIAAIRTAIEAQAQPHLRIIDLATEPRWPMLDNRLTALIANTGGGSVIVEEITLAVEACVPETRIDYSVPAAPLAELHLRAELRSDCGEYPLLALNGESARIYNERGAGAERLIVDLSCEENVRYDVRLRLTTTDLTGSGAGGELTWPGPGEPPLTLPFPIGPAWRRFDTARLHDRGALYDDMRGHLLGLAELLEDLAGRSPEAADVSGRMAALGIPDYVLVPMCLRSFIAGFVPALMALAAAEGRPDAGPVVDRLLAAAPAEALEGLPLTSLR